MLSCVAAPRQCSVEWFRLLLNVECDSAIVAANLMGVCGFVIIMFISIVIIKRRYTCHFYMTLAVTLRSLYNCSYESSCFVELSGVYLSLF